MNEKTRKVISWLRTPLNALLTIAGLFCLYYALRWLGIKGLIGIIFGMSVMAYLVLSENQAMMLLVGIFRKKEEAHDTIKRVWQNK